MQTARAKGTLAALLLAALLAPAWQPPADAALRPRYGGTLRVMLRASVSSLELREFLAPSAAATDELAPLLYESLVTLDDTARPLPQLAISWQADADSRRWEFRLRPEVVFHDGARLTPAIAAASVRRCASDLRVTTSADAVVIAAPQPAPDLPLRLAAVRCAVLRQADDGATSGTGPFVVKEFVAGKRAVFSANERHWAGRPFANEIEVTMNASLREQAQALELGRTDVAELSPAEARRLAAAGRRVWNSLPAELFALVWNTGTGSSEARPSPATEDARLREALALALDRDSIQAVLLARQGETATSLLPQWLSGYAFLFQGARDVARARTLVQEVPAASRSLRLSYDADDSLVQAIAERIAVNAREAGLIVQTGAATAAPSSMRLARLRVQGMRSAEALAEMMKLLDVSSAPAIPDDPSAEQVYAAEKALLESYRVIPVARLPRQLGLSPRVKNWMPARGGEWRLADAWLQSQPKAPTEGKP